MNSKRGENCFWPGPKRGQVTIFVIIAVVIVAGIALYFILRNTLPSASVQVPQDFQPVYNSFLSCIENNALAGISVLESQGGYIYLPQFQPGSAYQPFSSDLLFLGNPIPYWYYISGNNLPKNQIPNETLMQTQLASFIDSKIRNCYLSNYTDFQVTEGTPDASVQISPDKVQVNLNMDLTLVKGNQSVVIKNHKVTVNSELGNLFDEAKKVYDYEQSTQFLENYTIDVLRNYAPVDGVDISCSPESWNASSVFSTLKTALVENIMSIHSGINSSDYFNPRLDISGLSFMTDSSWPSAYEVDPTQGNTLLAQPIGNQEGLGVLGFCYVPYHFVYSVKYPVLASIKRGNEIFHFPMAVVIENNLPLGVRNNGTAVQSPSLSLCRQEKSNVTVNVVDSDSNPVNASISYECFGQTCGIGQAAGGSLNGEFPQCANGYIVASAQGFRQSRYLFSTVQNGSVSIVMSKVYPETINLEVGGKSYSGSAILNFISSGGNSQTVVYPGQKTVNLSEGDYTIQAYIYSNSSIKLGSSTTQECVNISGGTGSVTDVLASVSGQQQCITVNVPSQIISSALSGGGKSEYYVLSSELAGAKKININAPSFPSPTSIEQLQTNYILLGNKNLTISFS